MAANIAASRRREHVAANTAAASELGAHVRTGPGCSPRCGRSWAGPSCCLRAAKKVGSKWQPCWVGPSRQAGACALGDSVAHSSQRSSSGSSRLWRLVVRCSGHVPEASPSPLGEKNELQREPPATRQPPAPQNRPRRHAPHSPRLRTQSGSTGTPSGAGPADGGPSPLATPEPEGAAGEAAWERSVFCGQVPAAWEAAHGWPQPQPNEPQTAAPLYSHTVEQHSSPHAPGGAQTACRTRALCGRGPLNHTLVHAAQHGRHFSLQVSAAPQIHGRLSLCLHFPCCLASGRL